jgi:hypothetical protein
MVNKLNLNRTTINRLFNKFNIDYKSNHLLHRICKFEDKESFDRFCVDKYNEGHNIREVAGLVGTNYVTLREYFERNNFNIRSQSEYVGLRFKGERLTNKELEIINGCLLGDGSLYSRKYTASLSYCCKYKNICMSLREHLPRIYSVYPRESSYFDHRTNKQYTSYRIDSVSNFHLKELRQKWYPNGKKIIPRDLVLTPEICYWWYLGDGCSGNNSISLCTNGFTIEDVEFLINKFPVHCNLYIQKNKKTNKEYPMICITKIENRLKFLKYIGKCRHPEYNHRWIVHTRRGPINYASKIIMM